ncbi:MAG: hypothetical protein BWY80_00452 [Firmicutes bacterium ADurb.Bin456]|nr:MAG: hypothetical protein BWY80_00452 [Firmicutes bacterium ADurb.Bin456]
MHGGNNRPGAFICPRGDAQQINAFFFQLDGNGLGFLNGAPPGHVFVAGDTEIHQEIRPAFFPDIRHYFKRKAQTVGQSPAVGITALVGVLGHELGDQVAVGAMDLHPVKAGFLGPQRGIAELGYDFFDFRDGQFPGDGS